ncbi:MAG TPA: hypothetical protein VGC60_06395, partial [Pyrinomonadaceae bacterium]
MSANLATEQQFGIDFARSGVPFTPWLNKTNPLSEDAFEEQMSQVPQNQLPSRLRRELTAPTKPSPN